MMSLFKASQLLAEHEFMRQENQIASHEAWWSRAMEQVMLVLQKQPNKWAMILIDIIPETSEYQCQNILSRCGNLAPPSIISRRGRDISRVIQGTFTVGEWNDSMFGRFDLVILFCLSCHLPLIHQVSKTQQDYPNTEFFVMNNSISTQRAKQLLKTEKVECLQ